MSICRKVKVKEAPLPLPYAVKTYRDALEALCDMRYTDRILKKEGKRGAHLPFIGR